MVGRIDRSEVRDTPWDPLAEPGRVVDWNSRRGKPSWPAVTSRINRPDIWMQAIRSDLKKLLRHGGRPHMGPGSAEQRYALHRVRDTDHPTRHSSTPSSAVTISPTEPTGVRSIFRRCASVGVSLAGTR